MNIEEPTEKKLTGRDPVIGASDAGLSPGDDQIEQHLQSWDDLNCLFEMCGFEPNEPDKELEGYSLYTNGTPRTVVGFGGNYLEVSVSPARIGQTKNRITGKMEETRIFKGKLNEHRREMTVEYPVALHRLVTDFHSTKHSPSEWKRIIGPLLPRASREREIEEQTKLQREREGEKLRQAAVARENPTDALAAGIAAGVARALQTLNIQPKGAK